MAIPRLFDGPNLSIRRKLHDQATFELGMVPSLKEVSIRFPKVLKFGNSWGQLAWYTAGPLAPCPTGKPPSETIIV